jgi:hypothetical protein
MLRQKGSALVDYVLPIAVFGLILGLGLHSFISGGTLPKFIAASANMKIDFTKGHATIGGENSTLLSNLSPGELGGTLNKPVLSCSNNNCVIDYGDFILNGVPEHFGEIVETVGTAGGTESIVSIMEQIAQIYSQQGNTEAADKYKTLANLGHILAETQKIGESIANSCSAERYEDENTCFHYKYWRENLSVSLTNPASSLLPDLYNPVNTLSCITDNGLGSAKYIQLSNPELFNEWLNIKPSYQMLSLYEDIKASNYSPELTALTTNLLKELDSLAFYHSGLITQLNNGGGVGSAKMDFTGTTTSQVIGDLFDFGIYQADGVNGILHPQTSLNSNLNSILICAVSNGVDSGVSCD